MEQREILRCLRLMPAVSSGLAMLLVWQLAYTGGKNKKRGFLRSCTDLLRLMANRGKDLGWYQKCEIWLRKNGAAFHLGKEITPFRFLGMRFVLGAVGFLVVSRLGVMYGVLAMIFLYMLPAGLVLYLNGQDNKRLLPELKLIYHALEIQIRAGVYVTSALAECYGCVQDKRLKQALLDLAGDIVMHADLYEALEQLQGKFDNRHIDSLCIIILQAMESGQAVELLSDLAEQIRDMELTALAGKKEALDRSITFYQLGILAAVMGIVLYACVTQMFSAALHL